MTRINQVGAVFVPVADQERALTFYVDTLGFEKRVDFVYDIEAGHAALRERGVDVDAVIARAGNSRPGLVGLEATVPDPVPAQFFFRDSEGNRFLMVQPG